MNLLIALLFGHSLGDFYFQSNDMAEKKEKSLLSHISIYTVIQTIVLVIFIKSSYVVTFTVYIFLSHLIVDTCSIYISKKITNKINSRKFIVFVTDQLLHIIVLFLIAYKLYCELGQGTETNQILLLTMVFSYLIMPSSILVDKLVCIVNKTQSKNGFSLEDEGALIGILERIMVFMLGIFGNISGIGFLVAAKTMVRYGQFDNGKNDSSEKNFRSKYLIGTLSSILVGLFLFWVYSYLKGNLKT